MIKNIKELKDIITSINNEEVKKEELKPIFDNNKSFYNKAEVKQFNYKNNTIKLLYSYNTLICAICESKYVLNTDIIEKYLFSKTTLKHIKEFLKQNQYLLFNNLKFETKKDLIKYNNYKEEF